MKKLVKSIFHNFQSHKHTEITYSDFTGIVGPTDKGKSAMIRGIKWGLYNTPSGTEFIRYGETDCYVHHFFDDNTSIKRYRDSKQNYYDLYDANGGTMHLEAFGVGPVKEVVEFHGMSEVDFFGEKQSLNLCTQMSQPFFLAESAQTRAVMIGKLANTDVVDMAIKNTSSEIRESKAVAKKIKAELSEVKDELKQLKNLNKMEKDVASVQKNLDKMVELQGKLFKIDVARNKILGLTKQKETLEAIMSKEGEIYEIIAVLENITALQAKISLISRLNKQLNAEISKRDSIEELLSKIDLNEVNAVINEADEMLGLVAQTSKVSTINKKLIVSKAKAKDLEKYMIDTAEIEKTIEDLDTCQQTLININTLRQIKKKYDDQIDRKNKGDKVISALETQYNLKVDEYKQALLDSQKCPVCMSELTEDKVREIKDII